MRKKSKKYLKYEHEPDWMTDIRLKGLDYFNKLDLPKLGL